MKRLYVGQKYWFQRVVVGGRRHISHQSTDAAILNDALTHLLPNTLS